MANSPTPGGSESEICLNCGFCCDGTLFHKAVSGPGDTAESFIAIGLTPIDSRGERSGFRQPCPLFTGSCSIYASPRPWACGAFRCRLLKSVEKGKYTVAQAQQIVGETKAMRDTLRPVFDTMYADAVTETGKESRRWSMISRLRVIVPMLVRSEGAQFRGKYGKLLMTAFRLTARLTNDFLPPRAKKSPQG